MNYNFTLLQNERDEFIKGMKLDNYLSLKNKDDYYFGMEKAFDDAFRDYARRNKTKYATDKRDLMTPIVDRLFTYFNSASDTFDNCFSDCIRLSKAILSNNLYGIAQKFTNMSFKYLYCYSDADKFENKFEDCHMPLDQYTIKWIRTLKNKEINKHLNVIENAWSNIDKELYDMIQTEIGTMLNSNYEYVISHNKSSNCNTCILPENKLLAEFIIWHQEQINELYKKIKESEKDFERLGIAWC